MTAQCGRSLRLLAPVLLALLSVWAPATASASLPSWPNSRLLEAELRGETPLLAGSEIQAAAPHVHGAFCPHALPQPKTRVRGFELGLHCSIGGEAGLTCTSRPAYALRYGGHAVERSVFTGYVFEKEIGLYFANARFYDPAVGRFTSQDSFLGEINNPPSLHRFFYANANPTRYIDPTGHDAVAFWQAVSQGHGWDYTKSQLKQSATAAGQATKEWLGDVGMSISVGAARAMSMRIDADTGEISVFSPGHNPTPEYLAGVPQPQNSTERIGADLTDLVITAAPVLVPATRQPRVPTRPSAPGEVSAAGPPNPKVVVESAVPPAAAADAPVAVDPLPTTTGPPLSAGGSLPARPTSSPRHSTIYEAKLREGTLTASDANHFRQGNRQLHELFEADQALAQRMEQQFPGIVEHVKPGPRGGVADTPPPGTTWHHQPAQEGTLQLVPRSHHRSAGPVQETLHPEGRGGRELWGGGRGKTKEVVKEKEVVNTGGGS